MKAPNHEQAPPIWEAMKKQAEELKPKLLPKSTLGQAVNYFLNDYDALIGLLKGRTRPRSTRSTSCSPVSGNFSQRIPLENWFEFWLIATVGMKKTYTDKQGQYLAFIYYYSKIHGRPPAEADMQQYFGVSPPSVHQMILTLETRGLIERTPGQARSIHLLISPEELPKLI